MERVAKNTIVLCHGSIETGEDFAIIYRPKEQNLFFRCFQMFLDENRFFQMFLELFRCFQRTVAANPNPISRKQLKKQTEKFFPQKTPIQRLLIGGLILYFLDFLVRFEMFWDVSRCFKMFQDFFEMFWNDSCKLFKPHSKKAT